MHVTLEGVRAKRITTSRLTTRVLFSGPDDGTPVLFLHGNLSSATWWEETLATLPSGFLGIAPDQRGFGDADPMARTDARRGMGDLVDDSIALLDALGLPKVHVVGNSLGGIVIWKLLSDHPEIVLSATMVAPGSPFGFGGTKDAEGTPCFSDYAGSGGGLINPSLLQRINAGDRSLDDRFSPRVALRALVFGEGFIPQREEELLSATLDVHTGDHDLPGDIGMSSNWPFIAPGNWGSTNAASPKHMGSLDALFDAERKVDILWIRGSNDIAISDGAASDPATLGQAGVLPDYPGSDVYPQQPMLAQTRLVLEKYCRSGGSYSEVILCNAGHVPFLQKPRAFNEVFHGHLKRWS